MGGEGQGTVIAFAACASLQCCGLTSRREPMKPCASALAIILSATRSSSWYLIDVRESARWHTSSIALFPCEWSLHSSTAQRADSQKRHPCSSAAPGGLA